jgi:hypothetical protein
VFVLDTFEAEFPRNIEHWIVIIVCQTRQELKKFRYDCNGASQSCKKFLMSNRSLNPDNLYSIERTRDYINNLPSGQKQPDNAGLAPLQS